ncbi:hypothetical protein KGY73_05285 [bacterium]|nr:hypothetical protein [bacterium]
MAEESKEKKEQSKNSTFELLSWAQQGQEVTVRDDQYEFLQLLDGIQLCRQKGGRFRLIDSGNLDSFSLEWLGKVGADVYTSSSARKNLQELTFINKGCQKGKALLGFFHQLEGKEEPKEEGWSWADLMNLGGEGVYIYLVSGKEESDFSSIISLAGECQRGGSWLVYYHHGSVDSQLVNLAENGAWIHVSDQIIQEDNDYRVLLDTVKSAQSAGAGVVFHMEKGLEFSKLLDLSKAGASIMLKPSLMDLRYPFEKIADKARKKKLDYRAYYLYSHFFPGVF